MSLFLRNLYHKDIAFLLSFFKIPDVFGSAGPRAPATVAEIDHTCGIDLSSFEWVGAFIGVVVIFKGGLEVVLFKERCPGIAQFFRGWVLVGVK